MRETPFVGRRAELTALWHALESAGQGQPRLVLLSGEPGIGKTRLQGEVARRARSQGWLVLTGRAYELEGMPPYLPLLEALRGALRQLSPTELQACFGQGSRGATIARLMPELSEYLPAARPGAGGAAAEPGGRPEFARHYLFESFAALLTGMALVVPRGLLLCLDDLHWADAPALHLLLHLQRRLALDPAPLLIIGTHRPLEPGSTATPTALGDCLADLHRDHLVVHLALEPLARESVVDLITELAGVSPSASLVEALARESAGNPFFLEELVRDLRAEGYDFGEAGVGAVGPRRLPAGVRVVIARRLSRLSPPARQMVQVCALLGDRGDFDLAVLAEVSGIDEATLLDAVDEVRAAGLLRDAETGYIFAHPLLARALYEELSVPRRQRLHLASAQAIERVHGDDLGAALPVVARHYRLAGRAGTEPALRYTVRSAEAAEAVYAWEAAAAQYEAALELVPATAGLRRAELLFALGRAWQRAGDLNGARRHLRAAAEAARQVGATGILVHVAEIYARTQTDGALSSGDPVGLALVEEALAALGPEDSSIRSMLLGQLGLSLAYGEDWQRGVLASQAGVEMARRLNDPRVLALVLGRLRMAMRRAEHVPFWAAIDDEVERITDALGDPEMFVLRSWRWLRDALEAADRRRLELAITTCRERGARRGQWQLVYNGHATAAALARLSGDFATAEREVATTLAIGRRHGWAEAELTQLIQLFHIRREQGRLAELGEPLARVEPQFADRPIVPVIRLLVALALGDDPGARARYASLLANLAGALPPDANRLPLLTLLAEAAVALDDRDGAERLAPELAGFTGKIACGGVAAGITGPTDYFLGRLLARLGRNGAAEAHFEVALRLAERLGALTWRAMALNALGALLAEAPLRADRERATACLDEAIGLAERIGLPALAAEAARGRVALAERGDRRAAPTPATHRQPSEPAAAGAPSPAGRSSAAHRVDAAPGRPGRSEELPVSLTARQIEVLRLLAEGATNDAIAAALTLSPGTVKRHTANLYQKIGARNRVEAAAFALRHGLLSVPTSA